MSTEREVLVAVDGGAHSWDALAWAAAEAVASDRTLHVVHVVSWPTAASALGMIPGDTAEIIRTAAEALIGEGVRRAHEVAPDLRIVTQLLTDPQPGRAILRAAGNASLIVLGRRRDGRALRLRVSRSVGSYVARRASAPVVIAGLAEPGGPSAGRIAVVVDADKDVFNAVSLAFEAAQRRGIGLTVLHAGSARAADSGQATAALVAAFRGAFEDVDVIEEHVPDPYGPALSAASQGAALLVVGAQAARRVHRTHLTAAGRNASRAVRTPVAIVPEITAA